jgi:hypothetical protein
VPGAEDRLRRIRVELARAAARRGGTGAREIRVLAECERGMDRVDRDRLLGRPFEHGSTMRIAASRRRRRLMRVGLHATDSAGEW